MIWFFSGDAAYPLSPFMMTPFKAVGNLSNAQKLYNRKVSSVWQTIERTIGHLKGCFRRLHELYYMNIEDYCYLITSACILHNLCVLKNDDIENYLEPNPNHWTEWTIILIYTEMIHVVLTKEMLLCNVFIIATCNIKIQWWIVSLS